MKVQLKPIRNFDEMIELFGNPSKFKDRMKEYRVLLDEMNKRLKGVEDLEALSASRANIAALTHNAEAQYKIAELSRLKGEKDAEQLVEGALA